MSLTHSVSRPSRSQLAVLLRRPSFLVPLAVLIAVALVWGVTIVRAAPPQTLDQHMHAVASQLQCPACNGESVADSSAVVAQEMRGVIREKLQAGESDQQILAYFQQRYGDTILESPPKQGFTTLMWLGPLLALLAGLFIVVSVARSWSATPYVSTRDAADEGEPMSAAERERYALLLRRELDLDEAPPRPDGKEGA